MDRFSVYVPKLLPRDEHFLSGRRSCQGCGKALATRIASKALGNNGIISGTAAQFRTPLARSMTGHSYAYDSLTYDGFADALLANIEQVNKTVQTERKTRSTRVKKAVVGIDRRVFLANPVVLSRVFESDGEILYLCFDNEPYLKAVIDHTLPQAFNLAQVPHPVAADKVERVMREKNIPEVVTDAGFSYMATACPAFPFDYMAKVKKGLELPGNAFINVLSPCPTGWVFSPKMTARVGQAAVKTGYFPLYEIENGQTQLTEKIKTRKPVKDFIMMQGRYVLFPPDLIAAMQKAVDGIYAELLEQGKR
jgi:pyruvate ferredoxin oxidoreductase beta subunit